VGRVWKLDIRGYDNKPVVNHRNRYPINLRLL
jgi:hypothetical protein